MKTHDVGLISDLSLGAFFGALHGAIMWITTDWGTMVMSLALFGDEYQIMYIATGLSDAVIVVGIVTAIWWGKYVDAIYLELTEGDYGSDGDGQ